MPDSPALRLPRLRRAAVMVLVIAFDVVAFSLLALRASMAAVTLPAWGLAMAAEVPYMLLTLTGAVWLATLAWAFALRRPWARTAHALTCVALAAGAVIWILPNAPFAVTVAAQAASFALAALMRGRSAREWARAPPAYA